MVLSGAPLIDGRADEWDTDSRNLIRVAGPGGDGLRLLAATHERWLYLALLVRDDKVVYDASMLRAARFRPASATASGWPSTTSAAASSSCSSAAPAPARLRARRIETREYGREEAVEEPRIEAVWQRSRDGYVLEIGIPLSLVGQHIGVLIDDRDRRGATRSSYGTLEVAGPARHRAGSSPHRPISTITCASSRSPAWSSRWPRRPARSSRGSMRPRCRATTRACADSCRACTGCSSMATRCRAASRRRNASARREALTARVARGKPETALFAGRYENSVIVAAAAPIFSADGKHVFGVIQLAQTADRWLTLRDRALTRLLNLTLFVTLFAVVAAFWFAGRMTLRISRLGAASETALGREGNLSRVLPEAEARDELGDLSRSFSSLLGRLDEYTGYLRTLAGKLAHEIRTPLTIIRSSLENLESEGNDSRERQGLHLARPRRQRAPGRHPDGHGCRHPGRGGHRAQRAPALRPGGAGARRGRVPMAARFPQRRFSREVPDEAVEITGAPDLIVQMLDKLVDNAVDFSADGATISIVLRARRRQRRAFGGQSWAPVAARSRHPAVRIPVAIARRERQAAAFRPRALHRAADRRIPRRDSAGPRTSPTTAGAIFTVRLKRLSRIRASGHLQSAVNSVDTVHKISFCRAIETLWRDDSAYDSGLA